MIEVENEEWIDNDNDIQPVFTIAKVNEEDQILNSIENNEPSLCCDNSENFQEQCIVEYLSSRRMCVYSMENLGNSSI